MKRIGPHISEIENQSQVMKHVKKINSKDIYSFKGFYLHNKYGLHHLSLWLQRCNQPLDHLPLLHCQYLQNQETLPPKLQRT